MKKVFLCVFLIFGTIVGSGFSSGKEIFVFFSRFGNLSYLYIFLASFLFFLLFYLFLSKGKFVIEKLEKSKILNLILIFISIVFTSSMFAGLKSLFSFSGSIFYIILCAILLIVTVFITLKGMRTLEKVTAFLMPICAFVFLAVLIYISFQKPDISLNIDFPFGYFYCPLYVALNFSTSAFIVSRAGSELTKKQTFFVSLFTSLLLFAFLFFGNFVLRSHTDSFYADMPFLFLSRDNPFMFVLCYSVILVGCITTLFSLCLTLRESFKNFVKSDAINLSLSVFLPFLISELGFSEIVGNLYPISSVLGVCVLLFFILSFKRKGGGFYKKSKNRKE